MTQPDPDYLDRFQRALQAQLHRLAFAAERVGSVLEISDDIDDRWLELAPAYLADAVPMIAEYPTVSLAWAAFLGMGVAADWDKDWEARRLLRYETYYGERGFDDLDENILKGRVGVALDSDEAQAINIVVRRAADAAVAAIHAERIEPQSPTAFHIFARACTVLFRIGAGMELHRRGYTMDKLN